MSFERKVQQRKLRPMKGEIICSMYVRNEMCIQNFGTENSREETT